MSALVTNTSGVFVTPEYRAANVRSTYSPPMGNLLDI